MLKTEPHAWPGSHSRPEDASWPGQPLLLGGSLIDCGQGRMAGGLAQASWAVTRPLETLDEVDSVLLRRQPQRVESAHHPPARLFSRLPTPSPSPGSFSGLRQCYAAPRTSPSEQRGVQKYSGWGDVFSSAPTLGEGEASLSTGVCPPRLTLRTSCGFSSPLGSESHSSSMMPTVVYASCSHYFHSLTWFPKSHTLSLSHTHKTCLKDQNNLQQELCINLEGWDGAGDGEGGSQGREYMYPYGWFMLRKVWQKTTKFCKAVILQ